MSKCSKYNMQNIFIWLTGVNKGKYKKSKWKDVGNQTRIENLLKLQIENSINMGWDKKDIIPITNFDFEYMGVKAHVAESYCDWSSFVNKLVVINEMIEKGVITDNIWLHDCDCYQLVPFSFPEECCDWGYTRHDPKRKKNQGASGFFRTSGYDIIKTIAEEILRLKPPREETFLPIFYTPFSKANRKAREDYIKGIKKLIEEDKASPKMIAKMLSKEKSLVFAGIFADRFSFLNFTYNLGIVKYFKTKYPKADKPIKVLHFHIEQKGPKNCFYLGQNRYNVKVVTDDLEKLLIKHKFIK
jgi:hypothetical protein